MDTDQELLETLRYAQRLGFFGQGPIPIMIEHARLYLGPLSEVPAGGRVVDVGSGGGLPGLVLANSRADLNFTLVDRRQKRTDFLRRAISRLALNNAEVICDDVRVMTGQVQRGERPPFAALTARGFGPPRLFLETAASMLQVDGIAIISEPPSGDRWDSTQLEEYGLVAVSDPTTAEPSSASEFSGGVRSFRRVR